MYISFQACACSQFDIYAVQCNQNGVDLSNWRESVDYCRKFTKMAFLIKCLPDKTMF